MTTRGAALYADGFYTRERFVATSNNRDRFSCVIIQAKTGGDPSTSVQVVPMSFLVQTERQTSWFSPRRRLTLFTGAFQRCSDLGGDPSTAASFLVASSDNRADPAVVHRFLHLRNANPGATFMVAIAGGPHCPRLPTTEQSSGRLSGWACILHRCRAVASSDNSVGQAFAR